MSQFLKLLFSGADNSTPAIGRVLGALLCLNLLVCLPVTIALALWFKNVDPAVWFAFLAALALYGPAMIVAIGALIYGTNLTEPKP